MADSPSFDYRAQLEKLVGSIEDTPFRANRRVKITVKRAPEPIINSTQHRRYQKTGPYQSERAAAFARDDGRCRVCGESDADMLSVHHITRVADGGSSGRDNLIVLCANDHILADRGRLSAQELYGLILDS